MSLNIQVSGQSIVSGNESIYTSRSASCISRYIDRMSYGVNFVSNLENIKIVLSTRTVFLLAQLNKMRSSMGYHLLTSLINDPVNGRRLVKTDVICELENYDS